MVLLNKQLNLKMHVNDKDKSKLLNKYVINFEKLLNSFQK